MPSPRCRTLRSLVVRKLIARIVWGSPGTRSIAWSLNAMSVLSTSRTIPLIGFLLESVRLSPSSPSLISRPRLFTDGRCRNLKGSGLKSRLYNRPRAKKRWVISPIATTCEYRLPVQQSCRNDERFGHLTLPCPFRLTGKFPSPQLSA